MRAINELRQIVVGIQGALAEHAIIFTGDKRSIGTILLDDVDSVAKELAAKDAALEAAEKALRLIVIHQSPAMSDYEYQQQIKIRDAALAQIQALKEK